MERFRGRTPFGRFGKVVAPLQIALREDATRIVRWIEVKDDGSFDFGDLPLGLHNVSTCLRGFDEVRFPLVIARASPIREVIIDVPPEGLSGNGAVIQLR